MAGLNRKMVSPETLRRKLVKVTQCSIQGDKKGWPCGTCFFDMEMPQKLKTNAMWRSVLAVRGGCKEYELPQLNNGASYKLDAAKIERNIVALDKWLTSALAAAEGGK